VNAVGPVPRPEVSGDELLQITGLTKSFTGTRAVDNVDLAVRRGEIHALLGANGAGKSTIIKILAGVYKVDAGQIRFGGELVDPIAAKLPIAFIHQDLAIMDGLTIAENFGLALGFPMRRRVISWRSLSNIADQALRAIGAELDSARLMTSLSLAEKTMVAVARALCVESTELLVLDEPTASLPEQDVSQLFKMLDSLRRRGIAMLYVTHRLDEVYRIADRVSILRDGKLISTQSVTQISSEQIVAQIVGREPTKLIAKRRGSHSDKVAVELQDVRAEGVGPISFRLRPGEIVGLVGLRGAGQDVVGRIIFGERRVDDGRIFVDGVEQEHSSPAASVRSRIGFVSSNRVGESLAVELTVRENLFLSPTLSGRRAWDRLSRRSEQNNAHAVVAAFEIRPANAEAIVGTLSGGNQQRVVLARWLAPERVRVLVLEEPTLGVDVGARTDIYNSISRMVDRGLCVLVVSSDFEEVAAVCDRALVLNRGRVATELSGAGLSAEAIIRWATDAPP
jgi:ribose transport system ATP-binding protein